MSWKVSAGLTALALAGVVAASPRAYADHHRAPQRVFVITSADITESSSLVVSSTHLGLAYTANDSGAGATVYALATSSGAVVGRTTLAGVEPIDVEAMAACADGSLVVGDIGDNSANRESVAAYRLAQPGRGQHAVVADQLTLRYVDGPHDAESLVCDTRSGRLFVVTKEALSAAVYATAPGAFERRRAVLRPVAPAPAIATDATVLPAERLAVIRTYVGAALYRFPSWRAVRSFPLPHQQQGESIAAPPGGRVVWVGSEGSGSAVLAVRLPKAPRTQPSSPQPTDPAIGTPGATGPGKPSATADGALGVSSASTLAVCSGLAIGLGVWLLGRYRRQRARPD